MSLIFKKSTYVLILCLFLGGCGFSGTTEKDMVVVEKSSEAATLATGHYEEYGPERYKTLLGSEKFILFFHADWCPTCRALEKEIKENLDKLNSRTVLEVNYDTEKELKKEYGITVQSTVVFINQDGTVFEKLVNPEFELVEKFFY